MKKTELITTDSLSLSFHQIRGINVCFGYIHTFHRTGGFFFLFFYSELIMFEALSSELTRRGKTSMQIIASRQKRSCGTYVCNNGGKEALGARWCRSQLNRLEVALARGWLLLLCSLGLNCTIQNTIPLSQIIIMNSYNVSVSPGVFCNSRSGQTVKKHPHTCARSHPYTCKHTHTHAQARTHAHTNACTHTPWHTFLILQASTSLHATRDSLFKLGRCPSDPGRLSSRGLWARERMARFWR